MNLTGVKNAQTTMVSLASVADSAGNVSRSVSATMSALLGEVDVNAAVSNTGLSLVKSSGRRGS